MRDVLFVTIDSLRADHVGTFGYDRDTTPVLDDLAADGHAFERAFAHAQATRISFPAIMTGSTPLMYGGVDRVAEERTLISEVLDDAGYDTAGFHSNLFLSEEFGYARGYDTFYDSQTDPTLLARLRDIVRRNFDQDGAPYRVLKWVFDRTEEHAGIELGSLYTTADDLTDMAIDWLAEAGGRRRFCWVHYMDVHHPYVPPTEHQRAFRDDPISNHRAVQLRRKMLKSPDKITDRELQELIDLYDAEIRFTDTEMGRLLDAAQTRMDDPLIVITADHGEEFREHGAFSHGTVHKEGIHVPLIIYDHEGYGRYNNIVGLVDIAPTIADYADQEPPGNFQGYSLRPHMNGSEFPRDAVIGEWPGDDEPHLFYRDEKWKYIRHEHGPVLYYLPDDSSERTNVYDEYPDVVRQIEKQLTEHEAEIEATNTETSAVEMDSEVVDRLEQLGYKTE